MEIIRVLAVLRRRWPWVVVGVLVAALVWTLASFKVGLNPPRLQKERALEYGSASTQVLIDSTDSPLGNIEAAFDPLMIRAGVYARLVGSSELLKYVGRESGVPATQIWAEGPFNAETSRQNREPTAERRAGQLAGEKELYRLRMEAESGIPVINVNVIAPTAEGARRLADGAAAGLKRYIRDLRAKNRSDSPAEAAAESRQRRISQGGLVDEDLQRQINLSGPQARVVIRQLGKAQGSLVNEGVDRQVGFMLAGAVFVGWLLLIVFVSNTIEDYRRSRRMQLAEAVALNGSGNGSRALAETSDELASAP